MYGDDYVFKAPREMAHNMSIVEPPGFRNRASVDTKVEASSCDCSVVLVHFNTISSFPPEGNFPMSGIWVCATDQGRFFTSENPEQAPDL